MFLDALCPLRVCTRCKGKEGKIHTWSIALRLPELNPLERTPRRRRRTSYKIYPQGLSAVARTTVTGRTLLVQLVRVVTELTDLRARYSRTRSRDES